MSPAHANKAGRRYRYYVSQALLQQRKESAGSLPRLPAHDFEQLVSGRIGEVLGGDVRMKAAFIKLGWNNEHDRHRLLRIIIKRIDVAKGVVRVQLDPAAALADQALGLQPEPKTIELSLDVVKGAGGVEIATGKQSGDIPRRLNPAQINGMARGYLWRNRLLVGEVGSVVEIARKAGVNPRYVIRMVRMGVFGARHNRGHPGGPADRCGDGYSRWTRSARCRRFAPGGRRPGSRCCPCPALPGGPNR